MRVVIHFVIFKSNTEVTAIQPNYIQVPTQIMTFSFVARLRKLIWYERYKLQMLIESVCEDAMCFASERELPSRQLVIIVA